VLQSIVFSSSECHADLCVRRCPSGYRSTLSDCRAPHLWPVWCSRHVAKRTSGMEHCAPPGIPRSHL